MIYGSSVTAGEARWFAHLIPSPDRSRVVVEPPGAGDGFWAGAPSAAEGDGYIYLAYRLRRPLGEGRGYAVVVARSADGERFEEVVRIGKEQMGAESLERPALVRTPEGAWRLYLSCATTAAWSTAPASTRSASRCSAGAPPPSSTASRTTPARWSDSS